MKENILAIDVGTQSVRAIVFDCNGNLINMGQAIYHSPYNSKKPGYAEQSLTFYFDKLKEACFELFKDDKVSKDSIASITVTSQRGTVVNLDKNGMPLRPAIVWLDQRRATEFSKLRFPYNYIFEIPMLKSLMDYVQAETEINWIKQHEREIWDKTAHYLLLSGYINYKLTGEFVDSTACQVGYIPFDFKKQIWQKKGHWKWDAMSVKPETLPEIVPPGEQLGVLTKEAAELLGLNSGTPVISGASDKACEVLGCGCLTENEACIGFGTTATININSKRYIEPLMLIPPYPSAEKGSYNLEIQTYRGFWMVTWFKEQFAEIENITAKEMEVDVETLLDKMAAKVPAGSLGLMLQPYWSPGLRFPGAEAKGSIIGFGAAHKKQHMYRALLEGLAYAKRHGKERIEQKTNTKINKLIICGGGSRSDLVMKITAEVFGMQSIRPSVSETSALGAAILGSLGVGLHGDLSSAVKCMTKDGDKFDPDKNNVLKYNELYNKVYLHQYTKLKPLYKAIRDITGYPE